MELQTDHHSAKNKSSDIEQIWALIKATNQQIRETDRQIKETDRILSEKFSDTDKKFSDTDKKFKETDKKFKETDKKFKETDRVLTEKFSETDRVLSENFKKTEQLVGRLSNRWGEFVEGMVAPAIINMFQDRNIKIDRVFNRVKARKNSDTMEIDIIGANSDYVTVTEVKSKLISGDVKKFVEKLDKFKNFFPEYKDKNIVGAVAGINMDTSVVNFAVKKGLFVIAQKGEIVEIVNSPDFEPDIW